MSSFRITSFSLPVGILAAFGMLEKLLSFNSNKVLIQNLSIHCPSRLSFSIERLTSIAR